MCYGLLEVMVEVVKGKLVDFLCYIFCLFMNFEIVFKKYDWFNCVMGVGYVMCLGNVVVYDVYLLNWDGWSWWWCIICFCCVILFLFLMKCCRFCRFCVFCLCMLRLMVNWWCRCWKKWDVLLLMWLCFWMVLVIVRVVVLKMEWLLCFLDLSVFMCNFVWVVGWFWFVCLSMVVRVCCMCWIVCFMKCWVWLIMVGLCILVCCMGFMFVWWCMVYLSFRCVIWKRLLVVNGWLLCVWWKCRLVVIWGSCVYVLCCRRMVVIVLVVIRFLF